ncbi:hypothetical protein VOLCADRAFT_107804 [Volvox carteri f. nagariensis]|uniref:Uncharacterized protein n=1 Tax=Volvox carteri f. nagariensis TaxID=3068 RepID=D8UGJ1_VOLCA|nr:uncharacterized protein VOLCADRAFT_107804 [Volvox carteri f. nagariensis]EFJ41210.1 hypothetical protein VOLCADRAFT_107804 [Volvox carteri f. nagariensis]|eukprot:XP_002957778.1 hypothetical protein VOLCADRAFT_107804 [Volvox carteri f. nagariensis]
MERVADVPAHGESNRDPSDFALTNKNLVCCYVCRLIKSRNQPMECTTVATIVQASAASVINFMRAVITSQSLAALTAAAPPLVASTAAAAAPAATAARRVLSASVTSVRASCGGGGGVGGGGGLRGFSASSGATTSLATAGEELAHTEATAAAAAPSPLLPSASPPYVSNCCWHEVQANLVLDPVSTEWNLVLAFHDVTSYVQAELEVRQVLDAEHLHSPWSVRQLRRSYKLRLLQSSTSCER